MDYKIDIVCSESTTKRFLELYDLDSDLSTAIKYVLSNLIVLHNTKNVGKKVRVTYLPSSQKYIDYYDSQKFEGIIFFDDPIESNFFMIDSLNLDSSNLDSSNKVQSFKREGSHFMGMVDCYDGFIEYI